LPSRLYLGPKIRRVLAECSGVVVVCRTKARPESVDEYIAAAPEMAQCRLREMQQCLRDAAPGATESLKWGKPALSYDTILFIFAAHRNHISLHPTVAAIDAFAKELGAYKTSGGTVQFPLGEPLPLTLIRRIAAFRVKAVAEEGAP